MDPSSGSTFRSILYLWVVRLLVLQNSDSFFSQQQVIGDGDGDAIL
jgi:hypothetical protein